MDSEFEKIVTVVQNINKIQDIKSKTSNLNLPINFIDYGLDCVVFDIQSPKYNHFVLKVSRNQNKNKLNKQEYKNYHNLKNTKYHNWLCPIDKNNFGKDYSYILMEKVDTSKGNYEEVTNNLIDICSAEEISSHNIGLHSELGDVLIDYTYKMY